jgi:hypothetical protein
MYLYEGPSRQKQVLASFPRLTKIAAKNVSLTNPTYWFPEPNFRGVYTLGCRFHIIPWSHDFPLANAVATAAPLVTVGTYTVLIPIGD